MCSRCHWGPKYISSSYASGPSSVSAPVVVDSLHELSRLPISSYCPPPWTFFLKPINTCWTILSEWKMGARKNIFQLHPFKSKILRNILHCVAGNLQEGWAPLASKHDSSSGACPLLALHPSLPYCLHFLILTSWDHPPPPTVTLIHKSLIVSSNAFRGIATKTMDGWPHVNLGFKFIEPMWSRNPQARSTNAKFTQISESRHSPDRNKCKLWW